MNTWLNRFFKVTQQGSTIKTEIIAGLTTFLTMAYIVVVNPIILADAGMNLQAVFVATCIAAAMGCFYMAFFANYPIALAPGMGLNAYFTYAVVLKMGVAWEVALGAVFLSGLLFILISITPLREILANAIPKSMKFGIAAGLGLFLAIIGMKEAGFIAAHPATFVTLGDIHQPTVLLAALGFFIIIALEYRKVTGSVLISILFITILSAMIGLNEFKGLFAPVPSIAPTFMKMDIMGAVNVGLLGIVFVFFLVDLFDTTGTLVGVAHNAKLLDKDGKLPRIKQAFLADSLSCLTGAVLGTSTTTSYVESAAGTAVGGKTGLTALVVGICFLVCLWLSPLAASVPAYATGPALMYIGILMMRGLSEIDWDDLTESAPAAIAAFTMPFTFSIADGVAFAFIAYAFIKLLSGKLKDLTPTVIIITILWIIKYAFY
jgi:AGZA family xanthine/uracil permease-like MFS transporter